MEIENIVANTVYIKARESKLSTFLSVFNAILNRFHSSPWREAFLQQHQSVPSFVGFSVTPDPYSSLHSEFLFLFRWELSNVLFCRQVHIVLYVGELFYAETISINFSEMSLKSCRHNSKVILFVALRVLSSYIKFDHFISQVFSFQAFSLLMRYISIW